MLCKLNLWIEMGNDLRKLALTDCGASEAKLHIGITLYIVCLSVCLALLLLVPHVFCR